MARLLATDIDGTLLRSDGTVSDRTRLALQGARAAGRVVVLATGRPIRWVRRLAMDLELDTPVVCANGAVMYDAAADTVLHETGLDLAIYEELIATLRADFPGVVFGVETAREFICEPAFAELAVWPLPPDCVAVDGAPLCDRAPAKILVRHPDGQVSGAAKAIADAVGHLATVTHSTPDLLEIAALGVDKAAGLARLADEFGVEQADVVAFGDMPNDVAMLEWAGRGIAVANAHEAAIAAADEVTGSNDEDGVAQVVEALDRPGSG